MSQTDIIIRGAREHNLQNVDLTLPRNQLIVMTGVSGSGKSSLAFDTLYAEGQRRYVESLSSYARQFLGQMPKPEVDTISGLAPSISIQQKATSRNPRSTVGTITEIYDYLRVLFARVGTGHCPNCDREITAQSTEQILQDILRLSEGTRFQILAPIVQMQKGEFKDLFEDLLKQGFLRARVDGRVIQLNESQQLDRQMRHSIEVVVDRLIAGKVTRNRLADSVETAIKLADGNLIISQEEPTAKESAPKRKPRRKTGATQPGDQLYSSRYACTHCGLSYEPPSPQLFSFNSPLGMCLECNGLGLRHDFVIERLIPKTSKTVARGAIELLGTFRKVGRWRRHLFEGGARAIEVDLNLEEGSLLKTPWEELSPEAQQLFLYGTGDRHVTYSWRYSGGIWKHGGTFDGVIPALLESYRKTKNPMRRKQLEKYMEFVTCTDCHGTRLNQQARSVKLETTSQAFKKKVKDTQLGLPDVCALSIGEADEFLESLKLNETGLIVAEEVLKEIRGRLGFLLRCGLDYLTLDRTAPTLSGGESQRIRLAGQIGCGLVGVVYILDEPSIGLHPRDNEMLLESLLDLRDQGNTVVVVEHDEETMRAADYIIDFGPGPGVRGGEIVVEGKLNDVLKSKRSVTGQYLSGKLEIETPEKRRTNGKQKITIKGARHNNLRNVDVVFPLSSFVCITGVSGSGKSSLVNDILWQVLNRDVNNGKGNPGKHTRVNGLQLIDKAIDIDQSPIGRTPRSNPGTYVKLADEIRNLFAKLPESRVRGYKPGRFSFNVAGGRCEACEGYGSNKLEMDFLADIWVTCPVCEGNRFNRETLEVKYKGASIADVLEMDVQQALEHFKNVPKLMKLLTTLHDVGLDYIKIGQPSPTLSGGEAQRIKLARELGKRSTGRTVYLLDEPTTGLHFADIHKLLEVLHGFVDDGNTVIVVEHNLDVIKTADWIIDLGPEGGAGGGTIVAEGPPETIAANRNSATGAALAQVLQPKRKSSPKKAKPKKAASKTTKSLARKSKAAARHTNARWQVAHRHNASSNGNGDSREITVRGAAQHNLQNLDIEIPRDRMSVFCGPSGSGKSSLAMDTLYAEGQRRYVESLSSYARQFLGQMPKPKVEHIHGLSPAIAIEQKATGTTPRSTVGTVTEIYDYLRVLFARLGDPYCPDCNIPVESQTTDQVIDRILEFPKGTRLVLLSPQEVTVGQKYETLWDRTRSQGFLRVRIDGTTHRLEEVPEIDRRRRHSVEIVIDRITVDPKNRGRLADSIEMAFDLGRGVIHVAHWDNNIDETDWKIDRYSLFYACHLCGRSFEELSPHNFSFNSWLGWCEACEGLGTEQGTNLSALIADPKMSLSEGAISICPHPKESLLFGRILESLTTELKIPLDVPFDQLDPAHQRVLLYGAGDRWFELNPEKKNAPPTRIQYKGLYPAVEQASRVSFYYRQALADLVGEVPCSVCSGSRLRDDAAAVRLKSRTLQQICEMPLGDSLMFLKSIKLKAREKKIAGDLLAEATSRLTFLVEVGLHYLTLARTLPSLSGGENQRIRLAGQIGRALTGILYVLDEPTIGLHPRDNDLLLEALRKLRNLGNTLVLVEHDREVLEAADHLYDFGPGAGRFGGTVTGSGSPRQLRRKKASLTGQYLADKQEIPIPTNRRMSSIEEAPLPPGKDWLELTGACHHNLRNVDLRIPLGTFTCITGVSGSGKSSLIEDTLARAAAKVLHRSREPVGPHDELLGLEQFNKVITVDQQPLGSTPASNPATYTGVFDQIRELFTRLPESKVRGYRPGRFSFNRAGGRCDDCEGNGQKCIEMHFLPDVWIECDTCHGQRYNPETLAVKYRGRSIADVLAMPIGEAAELFENIPKIRTYLSTLCAIGLDYLTLGQSAPTLSGGEAQRVKLAAELARPQSGKTLYILDEPTTGLHFDDIAKLLKVLNSLVEAGNTVVVIEHNLDVIKTADWIVDVGPEAGNEGGWIVTQGTPENVVSYANSAKSHNNRKGMRSHTGEMLEPVLASGNREDREVFDAAEAAKKREGDLDLNQVGKEARMPWQTDGRKWHTQDRLSYAGKPCRWEGEALDFVVDWLEDSGGFAETSWNNRSTVEIMGESKRGGWFFHALTADEWLMTLKFRVQKRTFDQEKLRSRLNLKSVDDIDEIQVYGKLPRVRAKNLKGPWQEVVISVHWLKEINTKEFRTFLAEARESYFTEINKAKKDPNELMPWKVLQRKWHISRKGFPSGKQVQWNAETLDLLFDFLVNKSHRLEFDWGNKQVVNVGRIGNDEGLLLTIHTKRRGGIDLTLFQPPGKITLGMITNFGEEREIKTHRDGREAIRFRLISKEQVTDRKFRQFLTSMVKK